MKKILFALLTGFMLTGCYTHICPTYAVKPVKKQELKASGQEETSPETGRHSL